VSQILKETAPTRIDEVQGRSAIRKGLNLILGIYPFMRDGVLLGTFILVRDVTAEASLQDKYKDRATESITDHLTGLYNRNYFEKYLDATAGSLEKIPGDTEQKQLSVIMFDIDHFKKINDGYGHQAGDYILQAVSALMKGMCRKTDVICRFGGEEFVAIVPGTELHGASRVAQKVRVAIAQESFSYLETPVPVTISCGVAQFLVGQEKIQQTIARADAALYFSKAQGRNRVSLHDGKTVGALDQVIVGSS
jgi:diguanylate cyclase (GGDEF)-like protein